MANATGQPVVFNFNIQLQDAESAQAFAAGMGPFLAAYMAEFQGAGTAAQNHARSTRRKPVAVEDAPAGMTDRDLRQWVKTYQEANDCEIQNEEGKTVPMTGKLSAAWRTYLIKLRAELEGEEKGEEPMLEVTEVEVDETPAEPAAPARGGKFRRQRTNA